MNLTNTFAWVGPLDHKVKSVCICYKLQENFLRGGASNFTKDTVGCPIDTSVGDSN